MAYNKVVYDGRTLVDLTADTVDASVLLAGYTAHGKDGSAIVGTFDPLNMFYPVGSYYETSDTSFDPNTAWGGTWVLETAGQVHVSAGTGYAVSGALTDTTDGGSSTVTLDVNQIPAHKHALVKWTKGTQTDAGNVQWFASNVTSGSKWNVITGSGSGASFDAGTKATGGGQAHNNMQPYIVVNRWHRTA